MTPLSPPTPDQTAKPRAVLLWRPDSDESDVQPDVNQVAERLSVTPEAVISAIQSGDLLGGWFLDWEVTRKG